jgi:hypothetical protein
MKIKMNLEDLTADDLLDREYAPNHAERQRVRAAQQRRVERARRALEAEPIDTREDLSAAVAELAAAWGLKKKRKQGG